MIRKFIPQFIVALASMWLGWTVLVDFAITPTVFREIEDFFMAGFLGISVFSTLNKFEVIVASFLLVLTIFNVKKSKSALTAFFMSLMLWSVALFYFIFLTPKIHDLTILWKASDLNNMAGIKGIVDLQQEHQFYHRLYISMDSVKLLMLLTLVSLGILKGEEWK